MQSNHVIRKALSVLLAGALALSIIPSVFAVGGDTSETLSIASTIAFTAPANATFGDGGPAAANAAAKYGHVDILTFGTNTTTGLTITVKADPWVGPAATTIAPEKREAWLEGGNGSACLARGFTCLSPGNGTLDANPATGAGAFTTAATEVTIITSSQALPANSSTTIEYDVYRSLFTIAGSYTSAVHYTAVTN